MNSRADSSSSRPGAESSGTLREVEHRDGASGSVDLQGDHLPSPGRRSSDGASIRPAPDAKSGEAPAPTAPYLPTELHGVLAHPVRHAILARAGDRPWSATELAEELDLPRRQITDQIEELKKTDPPLLEFVGKTASPNGGSMRMYRATRWVFDTDQWSRVSPLGRAVSSGTTVNLLTEELGRALRAETLYARDHHVLYRERLMLDQEGIVNVCDLLTKVSKAIVVEATNAVTRMSTSGEEPIPTTLGLLSFEVAPKGSAPKKSGS